MMGGSTPRRAMFHVETHFTIGSPLHLEEEVLAAPLAGRQVDRGVFPVLVLALPLTGPQTGPLIPRFLGLPSSPLGATIPIMRRQ